MILKGVIREYDYILEKQDSWKFELVRRIFISFHGLWRARLKISISEIAEQGTPAYEVFTIRLAVKCYIYSIVSRSSPSILCCRRKRNFTTGEIRRVRSRIQDVFIKERNTSSSSELQIWLSEIPPRYEKKSSTTISSLEKYLARLDGEISNSITISYANGVQTKRNKFYRIFWLNSR